MRRVSRRFRRLLVVLTLTVAVGEALWALGSPPAVADDTTPSPERGAVTGALHVPTEVVSVRTRVTPACPVAAESRPRGDAGSPRIPPSVCASERHGDTRLYARLRVYRL